MLSPTPLGLDPFWFCLQGRKRGVSGRGIAIGDTMGSIYSGFTHYPHHLILDSVPHAHSALTGHHYLAPTPITVTPMRNGGDHF